MKKNLAKQKKTEVNESKEPKVNESKVNESKVNESKVTRKISKSAQKALDDFKKGKCNTKK